MRRFWTSVLVLSLIPLAFPGARPSSTLTLHEKKLLGSDLEMSGDLVGLPPGSTRYLTRDDLLAMPQVRFIATGDTNFSGLAKIQGVRLEDLARRFGANSASPVIIAVCNDGYRASYPRAYLAAHHPVLVLQVNDESPVRWPKAAEDHASEMGPYMISSPKFMPSFKILSYADEAQIPWGVVRLEFRDEKAVFGAIAPRGPHAKDPALQDGFHIAAQNCFRCHNRGPEGGQKSGRPWEMLAAVATLSPKDFASTIRAPRDRNPKAQMPGNPEYDEATLAALTAYFQTFFEPPKP